MSCTCCTSLPFAASNTFDVASDGTFVYVTYLAAGSQPQLGIVAGNGAAPALIASADSFVLASSSAGLFYAAGSGASYELHARAGTADRIVGTVTSIDPVEIAGNATDLYVSGDEAAGSATLWRFSLAGSDATPAVVATEPGRPAALALGASTAVWDVGSAGWLVSLPGPGTPTRLAQEPGNLVFVGDVGVELQGSLLTSHASSWNLVEVVPATVTLYQSGIVINTRFDELLGDPDRVYWRDSATPSPCPMRCHAPSSRTT